MITRILKTVFPLLKPSMKLVRQTEVEALDPGGESLGVSLKWLISDKEGAPRFFMRLFEIAPGGHTPLHSHPWEHEVFVVSGQGEVEGEGGRLPISPGDAVYVEEGEVHRFLNPGREPLVFICVVPSHAAG